ncbi:MAG TPA: 5-oxoprolinase subunit PxpA [Chitinophagaceae bacterium]
MPTIDINCDMGEGFPSDALLMRYISSANIACGYHAGDADTMKRTVDLCLKHNVAIGAHPSYSDRENFGRTDMMYKGLQPEDLPEIIGEQINLLNIICKAAGATLHHVKPHGALYNRAAKDETVSRHICSTIVEVSRSLILYGLSGSQMESQAALHNLPFRCEVFADRTYQLDGSLRPRSAPDALITDTSQCIRQVMQMIRKGMVTTVEQKEIPMRAETICIHGDGAHAVEFASSIHRELTEKGIVISHTL